MKKILRLASIFFALIFCGVAIFHFVEGRNLVDSLYATVVTLTTIGYGDVTPATDTGKLLLMIFILAGVAALTYIVTNVTARLIEGTLGDILKRKKMEKEIENLQEHIIVCGCGTISKYIIGEFEKTKMDFVVVDKEIDEAAVGDALFLKEDPTSDYALLKAGIMKARGLIAAMPDDRDNFFIVLTARGMNPRLRIIAKCIHPDSIKKIRKAGADSVVMPDFIGGMRLVSEMVRPDVVSFLDRMLRDPYNTIRVEEVILSESSPFCGKALKDLRIEERRRMVLIAMKRGEEQIFNPGHSTRLAAGDALILIDETDEIRSLREHVNRR